MNGSESRQRTDPASSAGRLGSVDPHDDSFDDPTRHDGHPHYDNFAQLTRWGTARLFFPHMVAGMGLGERTLDQIWNRAWTTALDGRNRVHAAAGQIPTFEASTDAFEAHEIRIGTRRVLAVRKPGDRG